MKLIGEIRSKIDHQPLAPKSRNLRIAVLKAI